MSIWWFAFGYFACYVPYSALVKGLSAGLIPGVASQAGLSLLPWSNIAALLTSLVFITAAGWWKHSGRRKVFGFSIPFPSRYTALSGLGSSAIIMTTTLAYTFSGLSIPFMMLLLRGGLLILAPIVDGISGRRITWPSLLALGLSLASLAVAFLGEGANTALTVVAVVDVLIYLGAYFVRLRFMSRLAKSSDRNLTKRYFVEEQLVATPALVLTLVILAAVGPAHLAQPLRDGFSGHGGITALLLTVVIGILSQGTGIFGGLILLDRRENSFCVPVNRASSMLAGLCAALVLMIFLGARSPSTSEYIGASLVIAAILVLSLPGVFAARRRAEARRAA
jgi:NADH:ubiquinone oxidoreductase subunit 6 (subunit J)